VLPRAARISPARRVVKVAVDFWLLSVTKKLLCNHPNPPRQWA
jgi:hypothetical protein